jgi:hypothetical protein
MKKYLSSFFILLSVALSSKANHISGGEMFYKFVSQSGSNYTYAVTLKLFRDPAGGGPALELSQLIAAYQRGTNILAWSGTVARTSQQTITLGTPNPCIIAPPTVSFDIALYEFNVTLPASLNGYTLVFQRCCRINSIGNIAPPSSQFGATYTAEIPGTEPISNAPVNTSAKFVGADTVIICASYPFQYNFVDDSFDKTIQSEKQFSQGLAVFTTLAILIASFGLLGMIIFTLEQRTKEIGIRKVIGGRRKELIFQFLSETMVFCLIVM